MANHPNRAKRRITLFVSCSSPAGTHLLRHQYFDDNGGWGDTVFGPLQTRAREMVAGYRAQGCTAIRAFAQSDGPIPMVKLFSDDEMDLR